MPALVDTATAKQHKQLASLDDAVVDRLILSASAFAEKLCMRKFTKQTHTERQSGDGEGSIYLDQIPVVSITSVTIRDSAGTDMAYTSATDPTLAATFDFDPKTGRVWFRPESCGVFLDGHRNVTFVYEAGFEADSDEMAMVREAVMEIAAIMYADEQRGSGVTSEKLGDYSVGFESRNQGGMNSGPWTAKARSLLGPLILHSNAVT